MQQLAQVEAEMDMQSRWCGVEHVKRVAKQVKSWTRAMQQGPVQSSAAVPASAAAALLAAFPAARVAPSALHTRR